MADDCIFCKIANHVIESDYVYEDDLVCAFRDMNPAAPTHVLVIPKAHYDCAADAPEELLGYMVSVAAKIAKAEGIEESGYRFVINTGADGGQSVKHLHLHLLGGRSMQWPPG